MRETWTNNVNQAPSDQKESDWITEIIPGIRISTESARLKFHLNYTLDVVLYANTGAQNNNNQSNLDLGANLVLVDNWLFLDAQGIVSQQAVVPFGPAPTFAANANENRTQTQTWSLSPYIKGQLGGDVATYDVRYAATYNTSATADYDSSLEQRIGFNVNGGTRQQSLGWFVNGYADRISYQVGRDISSNALAAGLSYRVNNELNVRVNVGIENNDYTTLDSQSNAIYGGTVQWTPTERTSLLAHVEHRFFGTGWDILFDHRNPFSSISVGTSQGVNTNAGQQSQGVGGVAYDLIYSSLGTRFPDPVQRAAEALRILQAAGLNPTLYLPNGFAQDTPYLQRNSFISLGFFGGRNSVFFGVNLSRYNPLVLGVQDPTNFDSPAATEQLGATGNWNYQISPTTTFGLLGNYLRTTSGNNSTESNQYTSSATITTQFGARTSGQFGARYQRFNSNDVGQNDYTEASVFAAVQYRFW